MICRAGLALLTVLFAASPNLSAQEVVLKSGARIKGVLRKFEGGHAYILVIKESGRTMLSIVPEDVVDKEATDAAQKNHGIASPVPTVASDSPQTGRTIRKWELAEKPFMETSRLTALLSATKRAQIVGVDPGSAADRAGLRIGDTIDELDGRPVTHSVVTNGVDLFEGKVVELTVVRGGVRTKVQLKTPEEGTLSDIGAEFRPESVDGKPSAQLKRNPG